MISVIVPVYNTEKYVSRCIESIINQSYTDWELILVDDGSTDKSLEVLREFEKKDSRIKVIHQENAGPGIARNTGISIAVGDYIVFVDSDDVIKPHYFKKLSHCKADIVFIDIDQVDENYQVISHEYMSDYRKLSKDEFLRGQMTGKILWGGVRKAVKRILLKDNNIQFTEHRIGEEAIYSFLILYYASSISFIKGTVYEYVNRTGSQSDLRDDDPWGPVALELRKKAVRIGVYEEYASTINAFVTSAAIVSLDKMANNYNLSDFMKKAKMKKKQYNRTIDKNYPIDTDHMSAKAKIVYPFFKYNMPFMIYIASYIKRLKH